MVETEKPEQVEGKGRIKGQERAKRDRPCKSYPIGQRATARLSLKGVNVRSETLVGQAEGDLSDAWGRTRIDQPLAGFSGGRSE